VPASIRTIAGLGVVCRRERPIDTTVDEFLAAAKIRVVDLYRTLAPRCG
jgi:hypothetical protein